METSRAGAGTRPGIVALVLALALAGGCATAGAWRPHPGQPATFALLLNGGGTRNVNYLSHAYQLAQMHEVLRARGLDARQIAVLASDGEAFGADLAVGWPARGQGAWLLDGTYLERPLGHPLRYVSTQLPGVATAPATRAELESWLASARRWLQPGDTLLVFVTDHGEKGKTPELSRITLWNRESVTAPELGEMIGRFPAGVRVVTVMSQCYSGGFAEMALHPAGGRPVGGTCGYFATTADRTAWGCYAESRGTTDEEGYGFRFIHGLRRAHRLAAVHAETLLTDRSPDVPLRSSDVYLARLMERAAARRATSVDALVAELSGEVLAGPGEEVALVRAIASSYAIPVDGALDEQSRHLRELRGRFNDTAEAWSAAVGELTQATLDAFLASRPDWAAQVAPRALDALSLRELGGRQTALVRDLLAFAQATPDRFARLSYGHNRAVATRASALRSEIRVAALLRLRTLLVSLVGRTLLEREGTPTERAELAALRACEELALPQEGVKGAVAPEPPPFPPISSDDRLVAAVAPASLGAALGEVPAAQRAGAALPDGAVAIVGVDPGSPASAVGLRRGDVLLGGPGEPVTDRGAMKLFLAGRSSGGLEILRDGRRLVVHPELARSPRTFEARDLRAAGRVALGGLVPYRGKVATALGEHRPYLLFFWATWCTFCKRAIPELLALEKQLGISVLAITDEPPQVLDPFFNFWSDPFPGLVAVDPDRRANEAFKVEGYPTFIAVDENGRVTMRAVGYRAEDGIPLKGWKAAPAGPLSHH
jgi:thiol-disulfide isomerase/thioredoxin